MSETQFYSYMWLREDGTPYYVGKGQGNRAYKSEKGHRPPKDKTRIFIFPMRNEAEAFESERALIDMFGRLDVGSGWAEIAPCLQNFTNGGENPPRQLGRKRSPETLKKMSVAQRGHRTSEETKQKIRLALKGKPTGRPMSEIEKAKLRRANLGRPLSEEHKRKLSIAHMGKSAGMFGLHHSEETKRKISQTKKARKREALHV